MAYRMAYQMAILTIMWVGLITLLCTMVDTDLDPCSHSLEVTTPMIIHMVAFLQTQLITVLHQITTPRITVGGSCRRMNKFMV